MNPDDQTKLQKITPALILEKKASNQRIVCLTAYDYPTAKLVDAAGIDMILVGDTLSEVVLGNKTTLPVTVDEMLHHTRAVRRAGQIRVTDWGPSLRFLSCQREGRGFRRNAIH